MCSKPFRLGSGEFGCGQCLACRINRQRLWTSRLLLESELHESSLFITLTYDNNNLAVGENGATLVAGDLQRWLKRLRRAVEPAKIRFFAVGEYGSKTWRPHYHALIFGIPSLSARMCLACPHERRRDRCDCVMSKSWGLGIVYSAEVNKSTIAYTAQYCLKKLTQKGDSRLQGRYPEFTRMSLRPGIGAGAVPTMAKFFTTPIGCDALLKAGDVISTYKTDGRDWPLGRYLRGKFREEVGWSKELPAEVRARLHAEKQLEQRDHYKDRAKKRKHHEHKSKWLNSTVRTKGGKL